MKTFLFTTCLLATLAACKSPKQTMTAPQPRSISNDKALQGDSMKRDPMPQNK